MINSPNYWNFTIARYKVPIIRHTVVRGKGRCKVIRLSIHPLLLFNWFSQCCSWILDKLKTAVATTESKKTACITVHVTLYQGKPSCWILNRQWCVNVSSLYQNYFLNYGNSWMLIQESFAMVPTNPKHRDCWHRLLVWLAKY